MMKAKLYATEAGWNSRHDSVKEALGIPTADGKTTEYAEIRQIDNESSADFGKYVFPVMTEGPWKCDQLFSGGLVDYDDDWFTAPPET